MEWQDTYNNRCLPAPVEGADGPETPVCLPDYKLNLEELLPMDLIRVHTKTDDVPSATDDQLALYRAAALESAEQYTGYIFGGTRTINEPIDRTITERDFTKGHFSIDVAHPVMDGVVYVYGNRRVQQIRVKPGARTVRIPVSTIELRFNDCCGTCKAGHTVNPGMEIMYRTGFAQICDIPAGIKLGMLKFVAWCVTHPGDEIIAVRNRTITRSSLVDGTNNVAWASGAIELWRQYDPDYI